MIAPAVYLHARQHARHHIQGTVVQRADNGWARVRVDHVFRGDGALTVGDQVLLRAHVIWPNQRAILDLLQTRISTWRCTQFVEVFLDGAPPECTIAAQQWKPLPALTGAPTMRLDVYGSTADSREASLESLNVEGEVEDIVRAETARILTAKPVLRVEDLLLGLPGFVVSPERATMKAHYGFASPTTFEEAFVQALEPIACRYSYIDAVRPFCVRSDFTVLALPAHASSEFKIKLKQLQGWVKVEIMEAFQLRDYRLSARPDLWQWGDESSCFLIRNSDKDIGVVFFARFGSAVLFCVVAGIVADHADSIAALMQPALVRVERYMAGTGAEC